MREIRPRQIVDWLNYWHGRGMPLGELIEKRVPVPKHIEDEPDDARFPLILTGSDSMPAQIGVLGVLTSLVLSTGKRVVARYSDDAGSPRCLKEFDLVDWPIGSGQADTPDALTPQYVVEWLNHWLGKGLPLGDLIEGRVDVPDYVLVGGRKAAYPIFTSIGDGAVGVNVLGLLSSLLEMAGYWLVANSSGFESEAGGSLRNFELLDCMDPGLPMWKVTGGQPVVTSMAAAPVVQDEPWEGGVGSAPAYQGGGVSMAPAAFQGKLVAMTAEAMIAAFDGREGQILSAVTWPFNKLVKRQLDKLEAQVPDLAQAFVDGMLDEMGKLTIDSLLKLFAEVQLRREKKGG